MILLRTSAVASFLIGACLTPPRLAAAQARDTVARADTVSPTPVSITRLAAIRVTASIIPTAGLSIASGVPARISILQGHESAAWKSRLLTNALESQPGISLYDDLGSRYKPTLIARGFTASPVVGLPQGISVFVDGVPVNEPDAGQVNFDLLPLQHAEQVELFSGTASHLGPNSLGGAINIITRRGGTGAGGETAFDFGSHGSYSAGISYDGDISPGWNYYGGGAYSSDQGWRQLTRGHRQNAFGNLGRSGGASGFNLQAYIAKSYAETAGSLPLSVYRVRPDSNLSSGDFEDTDQVHIAVSGQDEIATGHGSAVLFLRQHNAERFNVNQAGDPDVRNFSANKTLGLSADWRTQRAVGNHAVALRFGLGGSANNTAVRIYLERIEPGVTTHVRSPIRKFDAYTLAEYDFGPVALSAGARYDMVHVPFRNVLNPLRDTASTFQRMSPRGGLSIAVAGVGTFHVSAGQSFRAPSLIELACADPLEPCPLPFALGDDPPLHPVVATTYEAGGRWLSGSLTFGAAVYRTNVRDDIFLVPYDDGDAPNASRIDGYFRNISATRREGVEVSVDRAFGPLAASVAYGYTRATFQVDGVQLFSIRAESADSGAIVNQIATGDNLPLVPRHTASLALSWNAGDGTRFGLDVRHIGKRWLRGDEANEEPPLSSHTLLDLRAGKNLGQWSFEGLVRNALDVGYAAFGGFNVNQGANDAVERFLTPGEPREFRLTVRRLLK
jgi:outer membrane cobalamin receptor